ncbi:thioredoxin domain-containing protein 16 isoform X6 [Oncorhynchus clarkii lewisi]|uniref:thioredoxin domain-containing protein 16 isoform X6 n=1 Tax=Oncorhynchus clarkii lewisi TaxID=490388 RepID=UPI0039B991A0
MAWFICVVILLLCSKSEQCTTGNASKLIEHTAAHFFEKMQSGKMYFIYFGKQVNPTIGLFIEQLEKSADVLEDYGISVAKVNCTNEHIAKYCTGEKLMKKVYLFRGGNVLKSFDTDTVFDVDAIVSHVLFTVLFDEVRYVHTIAELQSVERAAKGNADIVLGHVQVLGLPEHRALMETAFVYGVKYQFVLTTGGPVLTNMGVEDISSLTAGLWFLHCKGASQSQHSDPCPHTALRRALTTLHIYTFLQLMEAPLVSEASVEPSEVNMVHSHLQVPLLFLFSQPHTVALDRVTAQTLAWRLRGQVGLVLIHRESPDVKIPLEYNAAYRLPGEGSEVKYLILNNLEEVIDLFRDESTPEEEEDDDNWATLDVLDDEVAESVYRDRGQSLDMDAVTELTADTFHSTVAESDYTVVLFYVKWDAVSMAFMQSYIEVSESLEDADVSDVELAVLDCGEWTDVCSAQKIRSFPTVRLYRPQEPSQPYQGMLGTESLNRFIMLSRLVSPVLLSSPDEVTSFLEGDLYQRHAAIAPVTVLGLFSSTADTGVPVFKEAAKALRGETMVGLFADRQAEIWAVEYSVTLPAILVSRGPTGQTEAHSLNLSMPDQLVTHIQRALLDTFSIQPSIEKCGQRAGQQAASEKRMIAKKAATVIDGGHSAYLMKVHMDQIQTLKTEIESLKAHQQKEKHYLRAEIRATADALVQSQAALMESRAVNDTVEEGEERDGVTIHARHTYELWNSTSDRQTQHTLPFKCLGSLRNVLVFERKAIFLCPFKMASN